MKKVVICILASLMLFSLFVGCNGNNNDNLPEGTYVEVTFCQQGYDNVVKKVEKGKSLEDIPTPKSKTGYTIVWDRTDFNNLDSNITVNAIETANKYKITLDYGLAGVSGDTEIEVEFDKAYSLPTPTVSSGETFLRWVKKGTNEEVVDGIYKIDGDLQLKAVWSDNHTSRH